MNSLYIVSDRPSPNRIGSSTFIILIVKNGINKLGGEDILMRMIAFQSIVFDIT